MLHGQFDRSFQLSSQSCDPACLAASRTETAVKQYPHHPARCGYCTFFASAPRWDGETAWNLTEQLARLPKPEHGSSGLLLTTVSVFIWVQRPRNAAGCLDLLRFGCACQRQLWHVAVAAYSAQYTQGHTDGGLQPHNQPALGFNWDKPESVNQSTHDRERRGSFGICRTCLRTRTCPTNESPGVPVGTTRANALIRWRSA